MTDRELQALKQDGEERKGDEMHPLSECIKYHQEQLQESVM